jgi:hypothetical protein
MLRSLLVKEGTMWNFASNFAISERARFFYMPQSWDIRPIISLPLRKKKCCGFFQPEKSDGFSWERTCNLGYQRQTTEAAKHMLLLHFQAHENVLIKLTQCIYQGSVFKQHYELYTYLHYYDIIRSSSKYAQYVKNQQIHQLFIQFINYVW